MDVSAQVAEFINRTGLLKARQKVIVGVSGGPDSLCLLDCLHRLRYALVLAHLDHQLRPESGEEARFCREMAERYGIPAEIEVADVRSFANAGRSLEEAARLLRYRFLARAAKSHKTSIIATGHTADDQVETILMHFLRGAGPNGLRGMLPRTSMDDWVEVPEGAGIRLVRPLLELTRGQTVAHCSAQGLTPIQDPSNQDPQHFRNRLRHELLPELETYNPGVRRALLRTGQVMTAISEMQEELVDDAWPQVASQAGDMALLLCVEALFDLPLAVQRALFRRAVTSLNPSLREMSFEQVVCGLEFVAERKTGSRQGVIGDLEILHMGDEALLWQPGSNVAFPRFPQMRSDKPRVLKVPGKLKLADGWTMELVAGDMVSDDRQSMIREASDQRVFIDADRLEGELSVRTWERGDRIQALGMKGRTKVAELFINEHIPHPVRRLWPLIVDQNQVVWIAGVRLANGVRLTKESERYIELNLVKPESEA